MKAKLIKLALHDGYRLDDENGLFIASTLESSKNKLSLKNCEAIARGYDLDELAENIKTEDGFAHRQSFIVGFQKALELIGDKAFNEKDGKFIFECGRNYQVTGDTDCNFYNVIQSLQQTEWDVTFNPDEKDSDGCLILKRL